jgi:hypothetical protein
MALSSAQAATPYDQQILGAEQQRAYAQKLREGYKSPEGQMVSGWYVAPSITQNLAELLKTYSGVKGEEAANKKIEDISAQKQAALAAALKQYNTSIGAESSPPEYNAADVTNSMPTNVDDAQKNMLNTMQNPMQNASIPIPIQTGGGQPIPAQPMQVQNANLQRVAALDPQAAQLAMALRGQTMSEQDKKDAREYAAAQADIARQDKAEQANLQRQFIATQNDANRAIQQQLADQKATSQQQKPLAPAIAKQQDELLSNISTSTDAKAKVDKLIQDIESKKLNFSAFSNAKNSLKNAINSSDPESQAYADFQSTLMDLNNAGLRLNSGVQTEGDAQRNLKALMSSTGDTETVLNALKKIKTGFESGVTSSSKRIQDLRKSQNVGELDLSSYGITPFAVNPQQNVPQPQNDHIKFLGFE